MTKLFRYKRLINFLLKRAKGCFLNMDIGRVFKFDLGCIKAFHTHSVVHNVTGNPNPRNT